MTTLRIIFGLLLGLAGTLPAEPVSDFDCTGCGELGLSVSEPFHSKGSILEWSAPGEMPCIRAVRPLFSYENDERGAEIIDILWPVGHIRHWHDETDWRFLTAFYFGPRPVDPPSKYKFWLLPLVALGRNEAGEDYGAVFPLGGRIDDFFGRDKVEFALFPLYWHSELNDLRTDHWLWPIISRTTGNDLQRFRVFPIYGYSDKRDDELSRFVLWPFWTTTEYRRPGHKGSGWVLFPVYGHSKTETGESWMVLPPFFRYSAGRKGSELICPWPFYQASKSKSEDKRYVWPLYGRRTTPAETRKFWAWPFVWSWHETCGSGDIDHFRLFPFYAAESREFKKKGAVVATDRYACLWPAVSYERTRKDEIRVRVPDLWPFRNTAPVERNLSPLWTLYLYKKSDTSRDMELLKGLVGYHRDQTGTSWRALYFIKWKTRPPAAHGVAADQ